MKKIKFFSVMLLLATMFIGFNACSDDDDDDKGNDSIVGKWKVMESGHTNDWLQFTSDKKFEYYHGKREDCNDCETYSEVGKYKVESGKLYMMYSDEEDWIIYKIVELNSISLIIQEYEDNGTLSDWTEIYQRMK